MRRLAVAVLSLCAFLFVLAPVARGQQKHPAEEKGLKSVAADIPALLKLVNRSRKTVKLHWINYDGKREPYATLAPGKSYEAQTFLTHAWLVTDEKGNAWAIYLPDAQPRVVDITGPAFKPPAPTPTYEKREIEGF